MINQLGIVTGHRKWTALAIECLRRGCNCDGCVYSGAFKSIRKCMVKATVLELVRVIGLPKGYKGKDILC